MAERIEDEHTKVFNERIRFARENTDVSNCAGFVRFVTGLDSEEKSTPCFQEGEGSINGHTEVIATLKKDDPISPDLLSQTDIVALEYVNFPGKYFHYAIPDPLDLEFVYHRVGNGFSVDHHKIGFVVHTLFQHTEEPWQIVLLKLK